MRNEYPRPQFERSEWLSLNGPWQFAFDNEAQGLTDHWEREDHKLPLTIEVPFCPESPLSGIHDTGRHEHLWYKREFEIPSGWQGRIVLHFGAVDYRASVYINGRLVRTHTGGHVGFSVDITDALTEDWADDATQSVTVFCSDPSRDEAIPRGKQIWTDQSEGIWYTRTSGIWQSVWLEPVSPIHIAYAKMTPDIDRGMIGLELELGGRNRFAAQYGDTPLSYEAEIHFKDELIAKERVSITASQINRRDIYVFGDSSFTQLPHAAQRCWSPHNPALFDLTLRLFAGDTLIDEVESYFGMRKVHTENGQLHLNNRPYYPMMVLDQGYWPEGLMTAPTDEALKQDIEMTKAMGFNGARKHQKVEDPRFMYWADKLGFLVWGEMAAASIYTDKAALRLQHEWSEVVRRDYNHPSIVAWVPFNESWGVPNIKDDKAQQAHTLSVYYMLKSLDQTRPVVNNDGWVMTKTDIAGIHTYAHGNPDLPEEANKVRFFKDLMQDPKLLMSGYHAARPIFADGFTYEGQPIMLTEIGGVAFQNDDEEGSWGYTQATDEDAYVRQLDHIFSSILSSPYVSGICYTQLTDIEQETNGLLTYDREYKVDPEKIRQIVSGWRPNIVQPIPASE